TASMQPHPEQAIRAPSGLHWVVHRRSGAASALSVSPDAASQIRRRASSHHEAIFVPSGLKLTRQDGRTVRPAIGLPACKVNAGRENPAGQTRIVASRPRVTMRPSGPQANPVPAVAFSSGGAFAADPVLSSQMRTIPLTQAAASVSPSGLQAKARTSWWL